MVFVTDLGAHCAHTYPIHHLTGVTVVPAERKGPGQDCEVYQQFSHNRISPTYFYIQALLHANKYNHSPELT